MATTLTNTGITFPDDTMQTKAAGMFLASSVSGIAGTSIIFSGLPEAAKEIIFIYETSNTSGPSSHTITLSGPVPNSQWTYSNGVQFRYDTTWAAPRELDGVQNLLGPFPSPFSPSCGYVCITRIRDYSYRCKAICLSYSVGQGYSSEGYLYGSGSPEFSPTTIVLTGPYLSNTTARLYYSV